MPPGVFLPCFCRLPKPGKSVKARPLRHRSFASVFLPPGTQCCLIWRRRRPVLEASNVLIFTWTSASDEIGKFARAASEPKTRYALVEHRTLDRIGNRGIIT